MNTTALKKVHFTKAGRFVRFLCLGAVLLHTAAVYGTTLNVSPGGALSSLSEAKAAVRALRQGGTNDDIIVEFQTGTYVLTNTVVFTTNDSAPTNAQTIYRAATDATVVFSGGHVIDNWTLVTNSYPEGLPNAAKGNVWQADVSNLVAQSNRFYALIEGDVLLPRAKSSTEPISSPTGNDTFVYNNRIKDWSNPADVEITMRPGNNGWWFNILPIESVDTTNKEVHLSQPCGGNLTGGYVVENAVDYLDEPGEWVVNTQTGLLYYWPESGDPTTNDVVVPLLDELVRVEGNEDLNGNLEEGEEPTDVPVRGLVFEGLTFTHADRYAYEDGDMPLQHDWDLYDKASGLLRFRVAEDCEVRDCKFINSGSGGIRLDLYCQRITVDSSLFDNLGATGILLSGYGPGNKNVNKNNTITNNEILNIGRLWVLSPGIFLAMSDGNTVMHNRIDNSGMNGLVISGIRQNPFKVAPSTRTSPNDSERKEWQTIREAEIDYDNMTFTYDNYMKHIHARNNLVKYNEISHSKNSGNPVYVSGTGTGNVIQCNALYNRFTQATLVRADLDSYDVTFSCNFFFGSTGGSIDGSTVKGKFYITNNIYINSSHALTRQVVKGSFAKRNIFFHPASTELRTFESASQFTDNLFYHVDLSIAQGSVLAANDMGNSNVADPLFNDIEKGDFSFGTNSPAAGLGIQPIAAAEFAQIGLVDDSFLTGRFLPNVNQFLYMTDEKDSDGDGLPDAWEQQIINDSTLDSIVDIQGVLPTDDFDEDGDNNLTEYQNGTDPVMAPGEDTDGDGLLDSWEQLIIDAYPTDNIADINDVLPRANNDKDGYDNLAEYRNGGNPIDSDLDGLYDLWEMGIVNADSEDDIRNVSDVLPFDDYDGDGVLNFFEYLYGSDPADPSSSGFAFAGRTHSDGTSVACDWSVHEHFVMGQHYNVDISSNLVTWDVLSSEHYNVNKTTNGVLATLEVILPEEYGPSAFFKFITP